MVNLKYAAHQLAPIWAAQESAFAATPDLHVFVDRDHGPVMDMATAVVGRVLAHGDTAACYYWRHLCLFLTFVLGVWALYQIGLIRFGDWRWALLASGLLVISPRLFADAFYNSSDMGLLAVFTLGIYTLLRFLRSPSWHTAVLHGIVTAVATDIRVMGLLLIVFTGIMVMMELSASTAENAPRRWHLVQAGLLYLITAAAFTVLLWPYLWEAPLDNLMYAFRRMSRFPWRGSNVYFGQLVLGTQIPWHYGPVWIIITTPIPYLLAALLGIVHWGWQIVRSRFTSLYAFAERIDLLFIGWLIGPPLLVILLQSVIYNGWRHLYFIYPALLLLAVRGLQVLVTFYSEAHGKWRLVVGVALLALGLETGRTLWRMVRMHPYQQVYFSFLPTATAERLFERDYWGLSYRQGLQWLLSHDARARITFTTTAATLLHNNMLLLPPAQQSRLHYREPNEPADYFITSYRLHPQPYPDSVGREVYRIYADGITILSIYQRDIKRLARRVRLHKVI
jgi:hypothetical protein